MREPGTKKNKLTVNELVPFLYTSSLAFGLFSWGFCFVFSIIDSIISTSFYNSTTIWVVLALIYSAEYFEFYFPDNIRKPLIFFTNASKKGFLLYCLKYRNQR
jgi:hypothetical protein